MSLVVRGAGRVADRVGRSTFGSRAVIAPVVRLGYRHYLRTGETTPVAYAGMRRLFGGPDLGAFERLVARSQSEAALLPVEGAGGLVAGEVETAVEALRRDGLAILAARLPEATCDALEAVARAAACELTDPTRPGPSRARFEPEAPAAVRYDVAEEDLLAAPVVQALLADRSLIDLAQRYLGAAPVQDLVAMWWTAASDSGSAAAAQLYHFDLDRLRFVKLFVYLTDVDEATGPHGYVRGTHQHLPLALRADRRFSDEEVAAVVDANRVATIVGPRGTMFLADTRGLHRGHPVVAGHRLVFQMEWATSLFGRPTARRRIDHPVPILRDAAGEFPVTYRRFDLEV